MAESITLDEVLAELSRLSRVSDGGPGGFTCRELAEALGVKVNAAQGRLTDMVRAGRVAHVGFRQGTSICGKRCHTPVYRMVTNGGTDAPTPAE